AVVTRLGCDDRAYTGSAQRHGAPRDSTRTRRCERNRQPGRSRCGDPEGRLTEDLVRERREADGLILLGGHCEGAKEGRRVALDLTKVAGVILRSDECH